MKKKISFWLSHPFCVDKGGSYNITKSLINKLSRYYDVEAFDFFKEEIDFEYLFLFDFTYFDVETIKGIRAKGVKVITLPIYDRSESFWKNYILSKLYFPVHHEYITRKQIVAEASHILVHNKSEWRDLEKIYGADPKKMKLFHYGISDEFFEIADSISPDLFYNEYKLKNFVFIPAAAVSKRKNQLTLIKALKGTNTHLVINNTNKIQDGLEQEFNTLTKNDPYIHCLESLSFKMLISAYKNAKVSVSLSQAETAGLVNLEAAYLGCNLVVSKLEAFYEYLQGYATFVDQNNPEVVRKAVLEAMQKDYDPSVREFIEKNYTWDAYIEELRGLL
jgi:glycosyltransferase involved in cell wall biosynthesis